MWINAVWIRGLEKNRSGIFFAYDWESELKPSWDKALIKQRYVLVVGSSWSWIIWENNCKVFCGFLSLLYPFIRFPYVMTFFLQFKKYSSALEQARHLINASIRELTSFSFEWYVKDICEATCFTNSNAELLCSWAHALNKRIRLISFGFSICLKMSIAFSGRSFRM